jgi:hypothetical protein
MDYDEHLSSPQVKVITANLARLDPGDVGISYSTEPSEGVRTEREARSPVISAISQMM